ncbi:MAG: hypothetical protein RQM92_03925 [Candidatus Syntrophopropionicum ammoniitolerans]
MVLIAGGKDKGSNFGHLATIIKQKVKALVVLGQSADLIEQAARAKGFTAIQKAADFAQAVLLAHRAAQPGEVVLLSPACASWDMFNSFEERGSFSRRSYIAWKNHSDGK